MSRKRQLYKASELKNLCNDENSCVSVVPSTRRLAISPFFLNDMKSGIFHFLNSILKKYDRGLDGILIGYQNVKVLFDENTGIIQMGKAETEVNVRVEFYIFQPKIGNYLEGVVNKKSTNHIGCLVHKYFNASILKPEDVEYEDWICKDFNTNDKITFRIKDLDFTGLLPYIEGIVDEDLLDKCQISKKNNINFENDLEQNAVNKSKTNQLEENKQEENSNYTEDKVDEIDSALKKTKKKKKEKEKSHKNSLNEKDNVNEQEETKESSLEININNLIQKELNEKIKKKKKKKKESNEEECEDEPFKTEQLNKEISTKVFEEEINKQNESDTNDKKQKKKDKKKKSSLNEPVASQINDEISESKNEPSFFYSTQLEPSSTCKTLEMSFCSPIFRETTPTKKKNKKDKKKELFHSIISTPELDSAAVRRKEVDDKEEKERLKMLKKLEKKKLKESKEFEKDKSLNTEVCEFLNNFSLKPTEKKKENKDVEEENKDDNQNNSGEHTSKFQSSKTENKPSEFEVSKMTGKITPETSPKKKINSKSSVIKEIDNKNNPTDNVKENTNERPKSKVQSLLDEILKKQISQVQKSWETPKRRESSESDRKVKSDTKAHKKKAKEKKKSLQVEDKCDDVSTQSDSLYEKLLSAAKSAMCLTQAPKESSVECSSVNKKIKLSENNVEETLEKKIESRKKEKSSKLEYLTEKKSKKRKRENSEAEESTSKKFKNGSMYDMAESSPEKNPKEEDKSLFTDSETNSPRKTLTLNGHLSESEVEKEKRKLSSEVVSLFDKIVKKEKERLHVSEGPRGEEEVSKTTESKKWDKKEKKSKKKSKKEREEKEESLYDKLLKDAKCLINSPSEDVPRILDKKKSDWSLIMLAVISVRENVSEFYEVFSEAR